MPSRAARLMGKIDEGFRRDPGHSLNAGNELDGEEEAGSIFFDFDDSTLAIEEELKTIEDIEARIGDLVYLSGDIQKAHGMNQSFAMEAEKLLPGFGGVPIGYYSKETSAIRLKVSLEEISKGVWGLIIAGIAALIAIIAKIFGWFSSNKDSDKKDESSPKKAVANIDDLIDEVKLAPKDLSEVAHGIQQAESALANTNIMLKDEDGKEFHCDSFQTVIDKYFLSDQRYGIAKKLLQSEDPIFHDVVHHGEYSKAMIGLGHLIRMINDSLTMKIDVLDEIFVRDLGTAGSSKSSKETKFNLQTTEKINKELQIRFEGREMTLHEITRFLADLRHTVSEKKTHDVIRFDTLYLLIIRAYEDAALIRTLQDMKSSLKLLEELNKRLDKIQDAARDFAVDGVYGAASEGVGSYLRLAITNTARDVAAFGTLLHQLREYAVMMVHLQNTAYGLGIEITRKMSIEMEKNKQKIPTPFKIVTQTLALRKNLIRSAFLSLAS
jgi:hypothetical protein